VFTLLLVQLSVFAFHNAGPDFACRAVSPSAVSSSFPHLTHDVLIRWDPQPSHSIHRLAKVHFKRRHEGSTVSVGAKTEIQSTGSAGDQLTRSRSQGHEIRVGSDPDLAEEQDQCSAQNNLVSGSRKAVSEGSLPSRATVPE
jgi:hypothetical protein